MAARSSSSEAPRGERGTALEAILPASVSVAAMESDLPGAPLFPAEAAAVAHAVESRRREFATARACARAALARCGLPEAAIPVGTHGEPRWPAGAVGSITHCKGYRACAVAREADLLSIGIDAEPNEPISARAFAAVAGEEERAAALSWSEAEPAVHWDRLLFSLKEAAFKAWFPLGRRRLGFFDVRIDVDPRAGTFAALLQAPGPLAGGVPHSFRGRWTCDGDLLLAAIAVSRRWAARDRPGRRSGSSDRVMAAVDVQDLPRYLA
jgi:4'-phosphopantetheinyl transferase EntD